MATPPAFRDARPDDYEAYVRLFPELGVPDRVPTPERFAAELSPTMIVAETGPDELSGLAHYRTVGASGYLHQLIVAPAARRTGLGLALMKAAAERMMRASCTSIQLSTKPDNHTALALYRSAGLEVIYRVWALGMTWGDVARLPADAGVTTRTATPDDDAEIERAAQLVSGLVAHRRAMPNRLLFTCERRGRITGFAAFDPTFPGATPFYAEGLEDAAALLRAMRPHARPEDADVSATVERDARLVEVLRAHGAITKLEIVRLQGPLPLAR
jgi:GNAT superfamily N-acetyltransferase